MTPGKRALKTIEAGVTLADKLTDIATKAADDMRDAIASFQHTEDMIDHRAAADRPDPNRTTP